MSRLKSTLPMWEKSGFHLPNRNCRQRQKNRRNIRHAGFTGNFIYFLIGRRLKTECILTYYADYSIIMFMGILETVGLPSLGQVCRTLFLLRSVGGFSLTREVISHDDIFRLMFICLNAHRRYRSCLQSRKRHF